MTVVALLAALFLAAFIAFSLWAGTVYTNIGTFRRAENPAGFRFAIYVFTAMMVFWLAIAAYSYFIGLPLPEAAR